MKHFKLNNYNFSLLKNKSRLHTYISGKLDKAYFKLSGDEFVIALSSNDGVSLTTLNIEYENGSTPDTEAFYFSTEYGKWATALQKFAGAESLHFSVSDSLFRIKVEDSCDVISLGIVKYDEGSKVSEIINRFITERKNDIIACNHKLTLTPEILADFDLMGNLFTTQGRTNSIGISKTDVMYSDRNSVVKANLEEELPDELFNSISEDDTHIYLHSFTLRLLDLLSDFNTEVYFDNEYEVLYWGDSDTEIIIYSDSKDIALPTQEQFDGIKPSNPNTCFEVNIDLLRDSLNFFNGFYDGTSWKPVTFVLERENDIVLRYMRPTADINKSLTNVMSPFDASFTVDSEVLRKILQKIKERFPNDNVNVRFNCDDSSVLEDDQAPGVYCTVGGTYEFIISKLLDE